MATNEEQLALEWRSLVIKKLESLETGQNALSKDVAEIKANFASNIKVEALAAEIEQLKLYKAKVAGIVIAFNVGALFIGWIIQTYLRK